MAQVINTPLPTTPTLTDEESPTLTPTDFDAAAQLAADERQRHVRARRAFAVWTVMIGLVVGFAGNLMFYAQYIGISMFLFALIAIGALLITYIAAPHRAIRQPLNPRNLWLIVPILFFAVMFAIRMNEFILSINLCAAACLFLLFLHYMTNPKPVDLQSLEGYIGGVWIASIRSLTDGIFETRDGWTHVREIGLFQQRQGVSAVLRGLMFTLPVLLVFAALLGAADQVFGKYLNDFFAGLFPGDLGELIGRGMLTFSLAWVAIGGLSYALWRRNFSVTNAHALPQAENDADENGDAIPAKRKNTLVQFTIIEGGMMLGSVNLLFAAFVLIQFRYLFGGQANITAEGFTFSDYARRGFYELLTVTLLTLGLALFMDWVTVRRSPRENTLFRGLSVLLTVLVGALIVSAMRRVGLYVEAYGLTDDRLYAYVFIIWLGGLFVAFLAQLFRVRKNAFVFGVLLAAIGYTGTMNLVNVDLTIAQTNIARYHAGYELDMCYLHSLSVDALPAILTLREDLMTSNPNNELIPYLNGWLQFKLPALNQWDPVETVFEFNLARAYGISTWQAIGNTVNLSIAASGTYPYCYQYTWGTSR